MRVGRKVIHPQIKFFQFKIIISCIFNFITFLNLFHIIYCLTTSLVGNFVFATKYSHFEVVWLLIDGAASIIVA